GGGEDRIIGHPEAAEVDRTPRRGRPRAEYERGGERSSGEETTEQAHRTELCTRHGRRAKVAGLAMRPELVERRVVAGATLLQEPFEPDELEKAMRAALGH